MVASRVETPAHQPSERFSIMPVRNRKKQMCPELKVIVLGNAGVGKSRLLASLTQSTAEPSPLGLDFRVKMATINDEIVKLQLWDTADQEIHGVSALPKSYFRRARGVLLVYDTMDRQSFRDVPAWATHLQLVRDASEPMSVVLVANHTSSGRPQVSPLEGQALATLLDASFVDCTASQDPETCLQQLTTDLSVLKLWQVDLHDVPTRLAQQLETLSPLAKQDDDEVSTTESESEHSDLERDLSRPLTPSLLKPLRRDSRFFAALELGNAPELVSPREWTRLALAGGCVMLCAWPLAMLVLVRSGLGAM